MLGVRKVLWLEDDTPVYHLHLHLGLHLRLRLLIVLFLLLPDVLAQTTRVRCRYHCCCFVVVVAGPVPLVPRVVLALAGPVLEIEIVPEMGPDPGPGRCGKFALTLKRKWMQRWKWNARCLTARTAKTL